MIDRTPIPRDQRPALPAFQPVPRLKPRHDGWTPERQVAFIEALADTGSVTHAARQVNMSAESAYALRRQAQADGFARAWAAALDMGVQRLKDEAFDRALHGQLVPIIAGGKLVGYRRKKNDRLLMFVLRHYGQTTPPQRAAHSSPERGAGPSAQRMVEGAAAEGGGSTPADTPDPLAAFTGIELDAEAQTQIYAVLESCAARARTAELADDPDQAFLTPTDLPPGHPQAVTPPILFHDSTGSPVEGDEDWRTLDEPDRPDQRADIAAAVAAIEAKKASGEWDREMAEFSKQREKEAFERRRMDAFIAAGAHADDFTRFMAEYRDP